MEKGIQQDSLGLLANAVDTAGTLDESDDRPRQVVVHDDVSVLQVLALAEDICRDKDPQLILRSDVGLMAWQRVRLRREPLRETGRVLAVAGRDTDMIDPSRS
ncbi:Uncharacterised protein [Mycobacteroides abscessus subsp. abscessus]|nr:Uncharacterised protein [Mycobacteroides abscessus subsp. abscessus]